jgi:class 3 adenylate cyclase
MGNDDRLFALCPSHLKIIDPLNEQRHEHIVNSAGNSELAEFAGVVNAVQCDVRSRPRSRRKMRNIPPERSMGFRGINLGDVMADGEQILR